MKPLTKILVNLEEHHHNEQAIAKAALLAERTGAHIELFCCCFNLSVRNAYLFDADARRDAQHGYLRQVETRLDEIARTLQGRGLAVGVDVAWDRHHAEGVIRKALRYEPDLLIHQVGQHSRLGHYLLAHRDWELLRECPVPLLLVKAHEWGESPRVAACVDPFHECDEPAALDRHILEQAAELVGVVQGELHAVHVFQTLPLAAIFDEHAVTDYSALHDKVARQHHASMRELVTPWLDAEGGRVHLLDGDTHVMLRRFAAEHDIDVMAMGTVARGVVDRLLLGSTIERVLDELECDVLVLKPPGFVTPVQP